MYELSVKYILYSIDSEDWLVTNTQPTGNFDDWYTQYDYITDNTWTIPTPYIYLQYFFTFLKLNY